MNRQKIGDLIQTMVAQKIVPGVSWGIIDANGETMNFLGTLGNSAPFSEQKLANQQLYDLASLTKVIGTTTRILQLIDQQKLAFATSLASVLPEYATVDCTIADLLLHKSGLPADLPDKQALTKAKLQAYIMNSLTSNPDQTVYSDLGFFLLGEVICRLDHCSLAESFQRYIFTPMNMTRTGYQVVDKTNAVPTEITAARGIIQGTVQDSKAYQIHEPLGSAGLFAPLADVLKFAHCLLNNQTYVQEPVFSQKMLQTLLSTNVNGRTFGWEIRENQRQETYLYHTGFTGTSIGMNLKTKEALILLTNRTYPNREERGFLNAREKIYNDFF